MKICLLTGNLGSGGIGRVYLNLSQAFLYTGNSVDIYMIKPITDRIDLIPKGVNIFLGSGSHRFGFFELFKYINREKPDLLISPRAHTNLLAIILKLIKGKNLKVFLTFHTNHHQDEQKKWAWLNKHIVRFADCLIAVSHGVASQIEQDWNLKRGTVKIIYNPIWDEKFEVQKNDLVNHPWLEKKEEPSRRIIISVGRLTKAKNYELLIRAFVLLNAKIESKLIILGDGEDRENISALINHLGMQDLIDLPGKVPNPLAYMAKADLFVLSSIWEGLPTVLVEALGVGLPIVSTNCPFGPAEILENGKYGSLVATNDVDELADAMYKRLSSVTDPVTQNRRAYDFSFQSSAKEYLALYNKAL